jgi:hypothetical protein
MAAKMTCTNHCSKCSRHFHSLEAFDAHRTGDYSSNDPEIGRRCLSPIEVVDTDGNPRMVELSELGECRMYHDVERPVTIWTLARNVERAVVRFHKTGPVSLAEAA